MQVNNGPAKPSVVAQYWPVAAILGAAVLVAFFAFGGGGSDGDTEAADAAEEAVTESTAVAETQTDATSEAATVDADGVRTAISPDVAAQLPITYAQAEAAGTLDQYEWSDKCDPETGRVAIPTVYAAPCVVSPEGVTGGATYQGVTEDTIKIVIYTPPPSDAAALVTLLDSKEALEATGRGFVELFSEYFEMWGREIEWIEFVGTGTDEISARADAQRVANEIGAFASVTGPSQAPAYADELAQLGVLCLSCGLGVPDSTFQEDAPYMWGSLQTPEQFLVNLGDYVTERVMDRPAIYAGDPAYHDRERTFGVVHFEQDPPVYAGVREFVEEEGASRGWEAELFQTYLFDIGTFPQQARDIVAQMKAREITTIVFLGDFLMPSYLTREATSQNYFPEWIITGTVFTDSSTMGRGYDQEQWAHAFGISSLPVPVGVENEVPWSLYEWYHGRPPEAPKTVRVMFEPLFQFLLGVHMAGPNLTPETFEGGLFNYPLSGGQPSAPAISYGFGVFDNPDYQGYDDVVEIWWDPTAYGVDEQGNEGYGMMQYSNGGKRYAPGEMPSTDLTVFDPSHSVVSFDGVPEGERAKQYPSPAE